MECLRVKRVNIICMIYDIQISLILELICHLGIQPGWVSLIISNKHVFNLFAKANDRILFSKFSKVIGLLLSRERRPLLGFGISLLRPCVIEVHNSSLTIPSLYILSNGLLIDYQKYA